VRDHDEGERHKTRCITPEEELSVEDPVHPDESQCEIQGNRYASAVSHPCYV
jgi:hypothetical protein